MNDAQLIEALATATDPLELARAAVQLAARRYSAEAQRGAPARSADDLKKALEELRRTEEGMVDLAERRRELVPRTEALTTMGRVARRFVEALDRYEAQLARQVKVWLVEPPTDEDVRSWLRERSRAAREIEDATLGGMLDEDA